MKIQKKKVIILVMILIVSSIFLITQETIIDSVYADLVLDGYIYYSQNEQAFQVNNWMYDMGAGDTHGPIPFPDPNSYFRSYVSFDLPDIPEHYFIDSVYVRLYQFQSGGYDASQDEYTDFPIWDVAGGDSIKCIMSHIDYGNSLDVGDWEKGDVGNPSTYQNNIGTITENGEEGYRYLDVTRSVIQDYELERDKTQYRIAFQIDTDWDDETDIVAFVTSSAHQYDEIKPTLYLILSDGLNSMDSYEIAIKQTIYIYFYPNPTILSQIKETTISYKISKNTDVLLQIFNMKGQLIETIVNEKRNAGKHIKLWNFSNYNSGIYIFRFKTGIQTIAGKCLLIK